MSSVTDSSAASRKKSVLMIGLDPGVVDFSLFPGLDARKLTAALDAALSDVKAAGFDAEWCLIDDAWELAQPQILDRLAAKRFAAVLIGAGIRKPGTSFLLFERIINVVHIAAPEARICFNTTPNSSRDAILRWIRP